MTLDDIAQLVREVGESFSRAYGLKSNFKGWCGILNGALARAAAASGFDVRFVYGFVGDAPHFWVEAAPPYAIVAEQWGTYAAIYDVTATQFWPDAPPVLRLECGDAPRLLYEAMDRYRVDEIDEVIPAAGDREACAQAAELVARMQQLIQEDP